MVIPANKGKKYPALEGICTPKEVEALLKARGRGATGLRNRALIALLYRSGLRCSEALNLAARDIDSKRGAITVRHGKGDKSRVVAVDQGTLVFIEQWVAVKPKGLLFCTLHGTPLDTSYVRHMLKRIGKRAGIEHRVHAHGLRHSHAYELVNENVPLHMISQQLGHSNIATTNTYVNHLNPAERIERIGSREWK
jgi:site-specific recombinase XerD